MIRITYVSTPTPSVGAEELFQIIEVSSRNNMRDGLTGFLVFARDRFFQLVEGPEAAIDDLLARLARDRRHDALKVLSREPIAARSFPRWQMKRLATGDDLLKTVEAAADDTPISVQLRAALTSFANEAAATGA